MNSRIKADSDHSTEQTKASRFFCTILENSYNSESEEECNKKQASENTSINTTQKPRARSFDGKKKSQNQILSPHKDLEKDYGIIVPVAINSHFTQRSINSQASSSIFVNPQQKSQATTTSLNNNNNRQQPPRKISEITYKRNSLQHCLSQVLQRKHSDISMSASFMMMHVAEELVEKRKDLKTNKQSTISSTASIISPIQHCDYAVVEATSIDISKISNSVKDKH